MVVVVVVVVVVSGFFGSMATAVNSVIPTWHWYQQMKQSINRSINQSINQINQPINQITTNQPTNNQPLAGLVIRRCTAMPSTFGRRHLSIAIFEVTIVVRPIKCVGI